MKKTASLILSAMLLTVISVSCRQGRDGKPATAADSIYLDSLGMRLSGKIQEYYNNDENDSVYQLSPAAMAFCREHELWHYYYFIWSIKAMTYIWDNQPERAVEEARRMQEEALADHNTYGLSKAYTVLGEAYAAQDNYPEMAHAFRNALDIYSDADGFASKSTAYGKYCLALSAQKNYQEMDSVLARWRDEVARHPLVEGDKDTDMIAHWHYDYQYWRATLYIHEGQYRKAEAAVDSATYYLGITNTTLINQSRHEGLIFELAKSKGDYREALASCNRKMALTPSRSSSNYQAALANRSTAYELLGQYREALADFREFKALSDSVRQKDSQEQLNELNKRFELNELKAEREREQMAAREKQQILYTVIASLLVIGLIVYIVLHRRSERRMAVLSAQKERMESELRIAHDIQTQMVPSQFPRLDALEMHAMMMPAKEVGGDLFDYLLSDGKLYFCLGDVSGKGVPAALFMTQVVRLFRAIAKQKVQPAEIAARINNELSESNGQEMFVTMFIGCLDMSTWHLDFCNCGHNPPVIGRLGPGATTDRRQEPAARFLQMEPNFPLGILPGVEFQGEEIQSIRGQSLFIYSDGLNEAENRQQEQFGDDRLLDILLTTRYDSASQLLETMKCAVDRHRDGAEPNDDLSMLLITIKE